ncbi:MAG: MFS transporter [Chloroflexi bacterium]|nr:MFS transporter [Chloroflexota bacterium]
MQLIISNPKFRLLWFSVIFNDMGLIMYMVVHGWLALVVTDSPFWVGATGGMGGLGMMMFSIFSGVLADRFDRQKLIIGSQLIGAAMALVLAIVILSGRIQLWEVLTFAFLNGILISVIIPSRMALTLDVAGRGRLLSANAANLAAMTVMGIVAPILGGVVISAFDIGWAYVIVAVAYMVSAGILASLRGIVRLKKEPTSPWDDLKKGVHYVFTTPVVRMLLLMVLVSEAFGWSHEVMLPVIARDVLDVGASGYGYLLAAGSAGGTVSTVIMSSIGEIKNKGRLLIVSLSGFGLFLMMFAASTSFQLSLVLLALAYAAVVTYETTLNTLLQTVVPDEMRGRVLSFQTFTWGVTGFSGFHTGAIASAIGAPLSIAIGGGVVLLNALRLTRRLSRLQIPSSEPVVGD